MTKKIDELLEVISEVLDNYEMDPSASIHDLRTKAQSSVASRHGVWKQTIGDKYIRGIRPEVRLTSEFDKLLGQWLRDGADELKNILLKHASESADRKSIENTFYRPSELDNELAQEFGFEANDSVFKEGKQKLKWLVTKERNPYLMKLAKQLWRKQSGGELRCYVCSFSFGEKYGSLGAGFIEGHHRTPVSSLVADSEVRPADLVPVCSNCHSMLHRRQPWLTPEELHAKISSRADLDSNV